MLAIEFVRWWYSSGWMRVARDVGSILRRLARTLSLPILIRTLFAPWKRIISSGGVSLGDRARAAIDNLISRLVGFMVRLIVIIAATIIIALTALVGGVVIVIWPVLPALAVALLVLGLRP